MKTRQADAGFAKSILSRADALAEGSACTGDLVELAEAYARLEDRLAKIIAISDRYQEEALESRGLLREALERLAEAGLGGAEGPTVSVKVREAGFPLGGKRDWPIAERVKAAVAAGALEGISVEDLGLLVRRYEKLEGRLDKIVRISDAYQSELREITLRMEFMARTDGLTKLASRRDMIERIEKEFIRYARYGSPFSLIIFDADDFKSVNDSYGHNVGDQTLRTIASVFGRELRRTDTCGRWGGEEFLVLCPETALEEALTVAEKCRLAVEVTAVETATAEVRLTISGGVAAIERGLGMDELIKRADDALYLAKLEGKNRVLPWDPKLKHA